MFFAAGLCYVFGEESLTKIELIGGDTRSRHQDRQFTLDVPSLDAAEYYQEFKEKKFAISDLFSFTLIYTGLTRRLKDMTRRGDVIWTSESWVRGRGR